MMCADCDHADGETEPPGAPRSPWAVLNAPMVGLILLYRATLSPFVGGHCRFHPTCSAYALEVYRRHNPIRATALTAWRLFRCQPFGGRGFDPPPPVPPAPAHQAPQPSEPPPSRHAKAFRRRTG